VGRKLERRTMVKELERRTTAEVWRP